MKTYHTLDDVQMSAIDRAHAMAHMQSAEATINFVVGAMAKARAVTAAVGRRAINLARRMQVSNQQAQQ